MNCEITKWGNPQYMFFFSNQKKRFNSRPSCISRPYSTLIASKMLIRCPVEYLGANAVDRARQTHSSCGHLNHCCQFCILSSKKFEASFCSSKFMILVSIIESNYFTHWTEVCFASFLSSGLIPAIVVNPPEKKLAKHTSVHRSN